MMVSNLSRDSNALVRPTSLAEARALLAADPTLRPMGGGTAVVPAFRAGAPGGRWLATTSIAGLAGIRVGEDGALTIGAATTLRGLELDGRVRAGWPLLVKAISMVAGPAIRNVATIGGSLALGGDSPDPALALSAYGATVSVAGGGVPVNDLAVSSGTRRAPFIEAVVLPPAQGARWAHERFTVRGAADRPFVVVGIVVAPGAARVVAAVGRDRPVALSLTATALARGEAWADALDSDLAGFTLPDSDRGTGHYRSRVLQRLAARAITAGIDR